MSSTEIAELIELAHAQLEYPGNWSVPRRGVVPGTNRRRGGRLRHQRRCLDRTGRCCPGISTPGLAAALLIEALGRLRTLGHDTVYLHVNTNNPGALANWRGLGFRPVGRRGRFERNAVPR
jgi:hypothetical protein